MTSLAHLNPLPPRRVLVADPDADARDLYCTALRIQGCETFEAADGRDALTKALVRPPSVVVTELRLPLIDGAGLCEILRKDRSTATVPIVVVTGETRPTELERARRAGADLLLAKPTLAETLLVELDRLIGSGGQREAAHRAADRSTPQPAMSERRRPMAKAHSRFVTSAPPSAPPSLTCPSCDAVLKYEQSYIGGVSVRHPEQWDYFTCDRCGLFQYRHRTRKLRHLAGEKSVWIKPTS